MLLCFSYDTKLAAALQKEKVSTGKCDSSLQFTPKEESIPYFKKKERDTIKHLKELYCYPSFQFVLSW